MAFLGRLLSCFVTERKHRRTKRAALHVFRHIDNTVVRDILAEQIDAFIGDRSLFQQEYLVDPHELEFGAVTLRASRHAVMRHGLLIAGDMVYMEDDSVGEIREFWWPIAGSPVPVTVRIETYTRDRDSWYPSGTLSAVPSSDIIDAVAWQVVRGGRRVIPPARVIARRIATEGPDRRIRF